LALSIARDAQGNLTPTGKATGTFALGSSGKTKMVVAIGLPLSAGTWSITANPNVALPDLGDLTKLLGGNGIASMMPANFASIGGFSISSIQLVIDPAAGTIQSASIALASTAPWEIVPGQLKLSNISIAMQILNPFSNLQVMGSVSGTLTIGTVAINAAVSKSAPDADWMLAVFVDPFSVKLDAFNALTKSNVPSILPQNLQETTFTVTNLGLTANLSQKSLQTFSVGVQLSNWKAFPPYLELDTITANLSLDWTSGTLYTSGSIGANFQLATIPMDVNAAYAKGNWTFVAQVDTSKGEISLTDAVRKFLPNLPANLPDITIGELSLTFHSVDYSFTFKAATGTQKPWKIEITPDIIFTVVGSIEISRAVVDGQSQFSGQVAGTITGYFGSKDSALGLSASYAFQPGQSTTVFKISYNKVSLTCTLSTKTVDKVKETILTVQLGG